MSYLIKPKNYKALLDLKQTELGIKQIKDFFQQNLSSELRLRRVTAPLFVLKGMGINDDLNGVERAVSFPIKDLGDAQAEVVHSLAKWKRLTLAEYNIEPGYGIYTDMNAIRADEELGNLHSLYVDQWDWERSITAEQRTVDFLKQIVTRIYSAMRRTEYMVCEMYPQIKPFLPHDIHFIHAEELMQKYPERCCTEDTYISTHNIEPSTVLNDVESCSQQSGAQLSKIDGVRLDFEDGFGIIRASNTGEYFTVRFDADNPSRLNDIRDTFVSMLSERYPEIAQDILDAQ